MDKEIVVKNENQNDIVISILGEFKIPELEKEFIMYSMVNNGDTSEKGLVLIGEVVRNGDNVQVLGIKEEEKDIVLAFYNEISNQLGEEDSNE